MLSAEMLYYIDKRCKEIFPGKENSSFAGVHVYLIGDFLQFPPVDGTTLCKEQTRSLSTRTLKGLALFKEFKKLFKLNGSHRQSSDTVYEQLLDKINRGNFTEEDIALLMERKECMLSEKEKYNFKNAVHLFYENDNVDE